MHTHTAQTESCSALCSLSTFGLRSRGLMVAPCPLPRYRPAQKTDGLGDSGSHGSPHGTPEQAMAAQSLHHQQYLGECPPPRGRGQPGKRGPLSAASTSHLCGAALNSRPAEYLSNYTDMF